MGWNQGSAAARRAASVATVLLIVLVIAACGSSSSSNGSNPPAPPTKVPTAKPRPVTPAPSIDAFAALRNRATFLVDGRLQPQPFVLDWNAVTAKTALPKPEAAAFCKALDLPKVDDALASLAALALNAVSEKFRHKPLLNEEADSYLKIAAVFATKSCPGWAPKVVSMIDGSTPVPTANPGAYRPLLANPLVTWAWSKPGTYTCDHKWCWQIEVKAPLGCPTQLGAVLAVRDAGQVVLRTIRYASTKPVGATKPVKILFYTSDATVHDGVIESIACR